MDEFDFLTGSSIEVFVANWAQVEENLIEQGKLQLKTKAANDAVEKAETAKSNYGNSEHLLVFKLTGDLYEYLF